MSGKKMQISENVIINVSRKRLISLPSSDTCPFWIGRKKCPYTNAFVIDVHLRQTIKLHNQNILRKTKIIYFEVFYFISRLKTSLLNKFKIKAMNFEF